MSIEVRGVKEIEEKLKKLSLKLNGQGMKKTMHTIGLKIQNAIEQSFDDERSPFGQQWKPISSITALNYYGGKKKAYTKNNKSQRKGFLNKFGSKGNKRILVQTGDLKNRWIVKPSSTQVVVSNNVNVKGFPYGLTHQFGSTKKNIPARPFLPVRNGKLEKGLQKEINAELIDEITRVFG